MNSRAESYIHWVVVVVVIAVIYAVVMAVVYSFVVAELKTDIVEMQVLVESLFSSPACLAYQDAFTGRVYPGIVDFSKFESCDFGVITSRKDIALKVVVSGSGFSKEMFFVSGGENTGQDFSEREALVGARASTLRDYPLSKEAVVIKDGVKVNGKVDFFVLELK